MNWFSSNIFKQNWFASRWWTNVTVPVVTTISGSGGGGARLDVRMYEVELPNLFNGTQIGRDMPKMDIDFWAPDIFENPTPPPINPMRKPVSPKPAILRGKPFARRVRHLDSKITKVPAGKTSECALCAAEYPTRDVYGPMRVLAVYCKGLDRRNRLVRHLG